MLLNTLLKLSGRIYLPVLVGLVGLLIYQGISNGVERRKLRKELDRTQDRVTRLQQDTTALNQTIRQAQINYDIFTRGLQSKLDSAKRSTAHLSMSAQRDAVLRILAGEGLLR